MESNREKLPRREQTKIKKNKPIVYQKNMKIYLIKIVKNC